MTESRVLCEKMSSTVVCYSLEGSRRSRASLKIDAKRLVGDVM